MKSWGEFCGEKNALENCLKGMRNAGQSTFNRQTRTEIASPLLNALLGEEHTWMEDQCEAFFEELIGRYCSPDQQKLLRAVSGIEKGYRDKNTNASARRLKYFNNNKGKGLFQAAEAGNLGRTENNILDYIADMMRREVQSRELQSFVRDLVSKESAAVLEVGKEADCKSESKMPSEPEPSIEPGQEPLTKLEPELSPEPQPEPVNPQPGSEPPSGPAPEPPEQPGTKPAPDPPEQPGTKPDPEPPTQPGAKPDLKPPSEPNPRPNPKPKDDNTKVNTRPLGDPSTTDLTKANKYLKAALITVSILIALILVAVIGSIIYLNNYTINFTVDLKERFYGRTAWNDELDVKFGDIIEYRLEFVNDSSPLSSALLSLCDKLGISVTSRKVKVQFTLPDNLEYVEGSTALYDFDIPDGISTITNDLFDFPDGSSTGIETITTSGIDIDPSFINANGSIRMRCRVVQGDIIIGFDKDTDSYIITGTKRVVTWATATIGDTVEKDSATLFLEY